MNKGAASAKQGNTRTATTHKSPDRKILRNHCAGIFEGKEATDKRAGVWDTGKVNMLSHNAPAMRGA